MLFFIYFFQSVIIIHSITQFRLYVYQRNKKFKNSGGTRFLYENSENPCVASIVEQFLSQSTSSTKNSVIKLQKKKIKLYFDNGFLLQGFKYRGLNSSILNKMLEKIKEILKFANKRKDSIIKYYVLLYKTQNIYI